MLNVGAFVEPVDFGYVVLVQPKRLEFGAVVESLSESGGTSMAPMPQLMRVSILRPLKRLKTPMWPKS